MSQDDESIRLFEFPRRDDTAATPLLKKKLPTPAAATRDSQDYLCFILCFVLYGMLCLAGGYALGNIYPL